MTVDELIAKLQALPAKARRSKTAIDDVRMVRGKLWIFGEFAREGLLAPESKP